MVMLRNSELSPCGNLSSLYGEYVYLERSRLNKILANAIQNPFVVVCAGAGYGKTRAVYTFFEQSPAAAIWIQLSQLDNTAMRFWETYVNAFGGADPKLAAALQELGFPETEDAVAKYLALLRKQFPEQQKYVLVLDNFHLISDSAVLGFFERLLRSTAPGWTIVFLSRTPPEQKLMRLFWGESVVSLGEDVLCFTESEIAEYLSLLNIPVDRQSISEIYRDTKGLSFAVNLIGRSLKRYPEYRGYAKNAMKLNIFRLIENQLFLAIPQRLQRFLIRLSLIDHLSSDLVHILAGDDALVRELEQLHAYVRCDVYSNSYLIHHLLLDYLREKQHLLTAEEKTDTYTKAAQWCDQNDYKMEAVFYYEQIGAYEAIANIVYYFYMQLPLNVAQQVLDIFERAPDDTAINTFRFPMMRVRLMISAGRFDEALALARRYEELFLPMPDEPAKFRKLANLYVCYAMMRQLLAAQDNNYDYAQYFQRAYEYYAKAPYLVVGPATSYPVCSWAAWVGSEQEGSVERCIDELRKSIPPAMRTMNGFMYGLDDLALGELRYHQNNCEEADIHLTVALGKAKERKQYDIYSRALTIQGLRMAFARGSLETATRTIQLMENGPNQKEYPARDVNYDIALAHYYLRMGQPGLVPKSMQGGFIPCAYGTFIEGKINNIKMIRLFVERQYSSVLAFLSEQYDREVVIYGKILNKIYEALCFYALKKYSTAMKSLRQAYELANPNRLVMQFIEMGKRMRTLTAYAMRDSACGIPRAWLEDINRKSAAYAKRQSYMISEYQRQNGLKAEISLSRREKDVLADLAQGLSRSEIAASCGLSQNTVKMITNNLYDKLGAESLADAIHVAADTGLI